MASSEAIKEQIVNHPPKRIKDIKFSVAGPQEIVKNSVAEICQREYYDTSRNRAPNQFGPLDSRLGLSQKSGHCETCGEPLTTCAGHYGHIKLTLPCLHIGYLDVIIHILQTICKDCSAILITEMVKRGYRRELRRPNIDNLRRTQICKKLTAEAKKTHECPRCKSVNGKVRQNGASPFKITHDRFSHYESSKAADKRPPKEKIAWEKTFHSVIALNSEIEKCMKRAMDDLDPLKVLTLFKRISDPDCELLGMNPMEGRPEMFIWRSLPVSPVCIRPSVVQQDGSSTEDDISQKIADICDINNLLKKGLEKGERMGTCMEQWEFLQTQVAMLINSERPGVSAPGQTVNMRGFCQRLKGKQGRFRGNLSGKRVDFSGRTVISPDPNLGIDEVAIPEQVAKIMTFPEKATDYNLENLQRAIRNGPNMWPGANMIIKRDSGFKQQTKFNRARQAETLKVGDTVERHLVDGDVVLFNRQPSLHKLSIMAHRVRVRTTRTFRLNECVCTPYNADFDGDEMNLHVPQTEEARAEALELMGVKHNLSTPRNGEPIIAAIQDFITGAYLLSSKDSFFDRKTFSQMCTHMTEGREHIDLPPPAIIRPVCLWTGKQVFNVLLRPSQACKVRISLDTKARSYKIEEKTGDPNRKEKGEGKGIQNEKYRHPMVNDGDGWLCIRDSQIMSGVIDKNAIGAGNKDSIFFLILRNFGEDEALKAMNRLARLISRYLPSQGFSIGIDDVFPSKALTEKKKELIEKAYADCDKLIAQFKDGTLEAAGAYNTEQFLEKRISSLLTEVRSEAGDSCSKELSKHNAAMIMAVSGSKGTKINVAQMVAVVGQQIINQERVQDGFQDRSLPHFSRRSRLPPSKGFVRNSFFTGLNPSELFFHAMSGREGLVDTAVKTAETGYMSRRLMKSLEDLSVQYDDTVRNSAGAIVQFRYGDDRLDPVNMEAQAKPVNFDHAFTHVEALTHNDAQQHLASSQVTTASRHKLREKSSELMRLSLRKKDTPLQHEDLHSVAGMESERKFVVSVEQYIAEKAAMASRSKDADNSVEPSKHYTQQLRTMSRTTLEAFIDMCFEKYERAIVQPGTAVGATGAQSIGEPGTQMTLKTFHFAGIANLQITQGVPRMKEIINATKYISTPLTTCQLTAKHSIKAARIVKGRMEQTFLRDIILWTQDVWWSRGVYIEVKLDVNAIQDLELEINAEQVRDSVARAKKLHLDSKDVNFWGDYVRIDVHPSPKTSRGGRSTKLNAEDDLELFTRTVQLKRLLPDVPVCGYAGVPRAIIKTEKGETCVLAEGSGLKNCMKTDGVDATKTTTNSIIEALEVLGIEAARQTIFNEITSVMSAMGIDPRHMQLLADVMTCRGEVLGITRFGLSKISDSVLQLASFEKTPDHLFEAAWHAKKDKIEGVSESIIMGQSIKQGTGAFQIVKPLNIPTGYVKRRATVFDEAWSSYENEQCV